MVLLFTYDLIFAKIIWIITNKKEEEEDVTAELAITLSISTDL
jgi:hypothetical protein